MTALHNRFKSIKRRYYYIFAISALILIPLIIYLIFSWNRSRTNPVNDFIFQAREAFNQGKTAGEQNEHILNVCNYEKLNLKVFCLEGYYASIEINQNNAPTDLFSRRIMALGYGYRLSKMNKDIRLELENIKVKSIFNDLIPYVVDGWSFYQYLKDNTYENFEFCQQLNEKWQSYCYFGAGRASFFKKSGAQTHNNNALSKYFFWGYGFAIKFLLPDSIKIGVVNESPLFRSSYAGIKLATFVGYKYGLNQPSSTENKEYSLWLSCSNRNALHILDCLEN